MSPHQRGSGYSSFAVGTQSFKMSLDAPMVSVFGRLRMGELVKQCRVGARMAISANHLRHALLTDAEYSS
jgi:hypothetical protein